jgi:hypothetical protein
MRNEVNTDFREKLCSKNLKVMLNLLHLIVVREARVMIVADATAVIAAMVIVVEDLHAEILTVVNRSVNKIKFRKSSQSRGFSIFRQWN